MRCVALSATGYLGNRLVAEPLSAGHDVPWRGEPTVRPDACTASRS